MSSELAIGPAASGDVAALNIIYNGYIVGSHISFDVEPWTDAKRLEWLESRISNGYPVLVARRAGEVVGSAWAGSWQPKQAYRKSAETTIVLAPEIVGHGVGRTLYTALLDELSTRGFHRAYAIIALPRRGVRRVASGARVPRNRGPRRSWIQTRRVPLNDAARAGIRKLRRCRGSTGAMPRRRRQADALV